MMFFGSAFASSKVVVESMPHEAAAALRFGGGAAVLVVILPILRRRLTRISRTSVIKAALVGTIGVFAYNVFFFWGLSLAPSVDGAIIVPVLSPILTALAMIVLRRERASWPQITGLALGGAGACIFLIAAGAHGDNTRLIGDAIFVVAAACWACYSIVSKSVLTGAEPLQATTWGVCAGAICLAIFAAPQFGQVAWESVSPTVWGNIVFLAVGPTAVAYLFYYRGLRAVSPTVATVMMFTVPLFGSACSYLFLREALSLGQALGAGVLLAGALLAVFGPLLQQRRRASATARAMTKASPNRIAAS